MATKKFVSIEKLGLYDEKIKALIDTKDSDVLSKSKEYSNSLADNYDTAGTAATKANEALTSAKSYTNTEIGKIKDGKTIDSFADVETALDGKQAAGDYSTKAETKAAKDAADAAQKTADTNTTAISAINNTTTGILAQAKKYADDEDKKVQGNVDALSGKVGTVPEGSTVMGIIQNIQDNAYDDTAINTKIDGVSAKVTALIGSDADKSVRTIANEELTKQLIPENADESMNTLQEIAAWIQEHPGDAAAMNTAISALQTKVDTGDKKVSAYVADAISALKIGDYAKAADLTTLAGKVDTHIADAVAHITAAERTKWNAALQKSGIATGTANGTIAVGGTDVSVKGLGSAAYTESTAYDNAGAAAGVQTNLTTEIDRATKAETALGARIDEITECSEDDITALFTAK